MSEHVGNRVKYHEKLCLKNIQPCSKKYSKDIFVTCGPINSKGKEILANLTFHQEKMRSEERHLLHITLPT